MKTPQDWLADERAFRQIARVFTVHPNEPAVLVVETETELFAVCARYVKLLGNLRNVKSRTTVTRGDYNAALAAKGVSPPVLEPEPSLEVGGIKEVKDKKSGNKTT